MGNYSTERRAFQITKNADLERLILGVTSNETAAIKLKTMNSEPIRLDGAL